ncbi:hypothetical protein [Microtetraspora sp. NBRC 13810]|nr:hypothetical protein [Microtetraspora sp. NBRC 13810]
MPITRAFADRLRDDRRTPAAGAASPPTVAPWGVPCPRRLTVLGPDG